MELDSIGFVACPQRGADLCPYHSKHGVLLWRDDDHAAIPGTRGRCDLARDETRADDQNSASRPELTGKFPGVVERPQHVSAAGGTRNGQATSAESGGNDETIEILA
ncbi:hypothetical protein GCM10023094_55720 [Rhodococcus olei]|uniref:Uncharacterized protein n=1 Tax=Rhodococcus olei TaxID=2161675 RepID=A0ABP8PTP9_9NOCA